MIKSAIRYVLITIGVFVVGLFIWDMWGRDGNMDSLFLGIWDGFYAVVRAIVDFLKTAWVDLFD